ncbi:MULTISPECIES: zinc-binding dehydrogenase [Arenibacter]|uniref:zinc-binding dehydrogenase n=1 Tax=Arenibacter TaxID=178469 RepID=UPI00186543E7|nr:MULTISPECIES: zinc-binding dehydrogenase [Arenibacter]
MLKAKLFNSKFQVFHGVGKPFSFEGKAQEIKLNTGEALVKIVLATICGSDLHTIEGKRKEDVPCILGHEAVGEIIDISGRPGFKIGDRVTWTIADSCGKCPACNDYGLPEKCNELFKYGHASMSEGSGLNGCYSTVIHIRKGTHLVKVPAMINNSIAAPANCALATMVNAVSQAKKFPKKVVVQGGGLLGVYACALLKEMGVPNIYCLEVNENRFDLIRKFGAIPVDARDTLKATQCILNKIGDGADVIFEVAGVKELIQQGVELLRPGGEYILVGLVHPDSELSITAEQIIRKCISIKGVHNYAPWHLEEAVAFLDRNYMNFPFEELVSPPFGLENISEAIVEAKKQNWFRVSLNPQL